MKDVYFNDYDKKKKHDSEYDTSEIPLTSSERDFQDRINQQRYEKILKNQQQNLHESNNYDNLSSYRNERPVQRSNREEYDINSHEHRDQRTNPRRSSPSNPPKKAEKKKHRGCGCGLLFVCFILIIALACGGSFGYVYSLCEKTNYVESSVVSDGTQLMSSDDIYNVLLIGADKDEYGTSRSDTMMLVSIDKKNQTVKFTSFMRDMWVSIPDNGKSKLNAAYAYGGATLLMETIERNFKIDINNYVMVDFDMFEKLIDGLGGVTVEITEDEAEFINRTSHAEVQAGTNTLNGDYALIYCRIRKLDSDFMRTQRQRKVMSAIMEKIKSQSILKTASAMTDVLPLVTTDMKAMDMTLKVFSSISLLKYENDQLRIPADGMYTSKRINGQDALVPDLEDNVKELRTFIYG